VNSVVIGLTAVLLLYLLSRLNFLKWPIIVVIGMFLLDAKTMAFSINGMETAYLVFFVFLTFYALCTEVARRPLLLGVAWGGLMWTRPDGCIYVAAIALAWFLFCPVFRDIPNRKAYVMLFIKAGLITTVLYLPWVLWAWWYYGTPVPHTVTAKSGMGQQMGLIEKFATRI